MTKKYAVLGKPISHSLSPIIHRTILSSLKIDASYDSFELGSGLNEFLNEHLDFSGFSVTMPLKDEALALSTTIDDASKVSRSVNTLVKSHHGWVGFNTDIFGIQMSLRDADLSSVLVIGTGATSRSAIAALRHLTSSLKLWGRDQERAFSLASEFGVGVAERVAEASDFSTVVSTLPALALDSSVSQIVNPKGTLLDVAYHPWPSKAAEHWSKSGSAISGLEMLIWQAVMQQRIFSGDGADSPLQNEGAIVDAVRKALSVAQ